MELEKICDLWIAYLEESNFRKDKGESLYNDYVGRIKAASKNRQLTSWPTVSNLSDILEGIIDRAYSDAKSDGDLSFEHIKQRLIYNIKLIERTALLLHIHCGGILPRGGQKAVLQEIGNFLNTKLKSIKKIRKCYQTWTAPGEKVYPEVELYLEIYRGRKKGLSNKELLKVANRIALETGSNRLNKEEPYLEESQISRMIGYAKKIIQNVEKGNFPGNYR